MFYGYAHLQYIVSIHALLAECDDIMDALKRACEVSIHALLAECDWGT